MGLLALVFVIVFVLVVPFSLAAPRSQTAVRFLEGFVAAEAAIGVVAYRGYRRTGEPFLEVFPLGVPPGPFPIWMLLQLAGVVALSAGLAGALETVWHKPAAMRAMHQRVLEGGGSFAAAVVAIVIVGPFFEELLFRGLILHGLLRTYRRGTAIWMSALLFALFHLNPWQFFSALVGGAVFGGWLAETGSLWFCIIGHAAVNAIPVVLHEVRRGDPGAKSAVPASPAAILALCAAGALLVGGGAWLLSKRRAMGKSGATPPTPS